LATQFQTRFLESIPRPIAGLKFSTQESQVSADPNLKNKEFCTLNFAQVFEDNLMIYIIAGCVTGITLIIIIVIVISVRISRTKSTKKKPRQEFIREIRDGLQPVRLAHGPNNYKDTTP
jgi:hypothetical protein